MPVIDDTILTPKQRWTRCAQCSYYMLPHEKVCPRCGHPAPDMALVETGILTRNPLTLPAERSGNDLFAVGAQAVFQFLPSGLCLALPVKRPVILGRGAPSTAEELVDLTDLNALRHGVSRRHCILQRRDPHLILMDLGSTNGTYLNGMLLRAHQSYTMMDGDQLILGTLRVAVAFRAG
jgi:hypothetical protein